MPQLQHQQILVVDDDADTRSLFQLLLETEGATVQTAASVAEALTLLMQRKVDVVLSDIAMPKADGWTLLHRLRRSDCQELRQLPVIAVTATAGLEMTEKAKRASFAACLFKPIDVDKLIDTVVGTLSAKTYWSETVKAPVLFQDYSSDTSLSIAWRSRD